MSLCARFAREIVLHREPNFGEAAYEDLPRGLSGYGEDYGPRHSQRYEGEPFRCCPFDDSNGDSHHEGRALAVCARDLDITAHHLDQPLADRKSKSSTSILPRR